MSMATPAPMLQRRRTHSNVLLTTPQPSHPYLGGNFAPIHQTLPLTPCRYTGDLPPELADGEYVRNGSNPVTNEDLGRNAHWFDGDGMLSGVSFRLDPLTKNIQPEFVNQYILTDVYLSATTSRRLKVPILPSIATLVNPLASFLYVTFCILRTIVLVILSHCPGSKHAIKKISVANTNIVYHDGRALATCESGPPMRIQLPGLQTVGWYNGREAEGEHVKPALSESASSSVFGEDAGLLQFMREWTTAHPKVDPITKEMLMFHSSFAPPYVQYSVIPQDRVENANSQPHLPPKRKLLNAAVPGVTGPKMMHDFGVSSQYTVIMNLPLSLDPLNQLRGKPPVNYDSSMPSRFGVFPRQDPTAVRWFETDACCIFHTANTWDSVDAMRNVRSVNMLACRLTSATLVFAAGNMAPPPKPRKVVAPRPKRMPFFSKYDQNTEECLVSVQPEGLHDDEKRPLLRMLDNEATSDALILEDQCRLYYYSFSLDDGGIEYQWALATIPFEFPSVHPAMEMQEARYIYGCSTTMTSFGAALGKATKIDAIVKMDAATLINRGKLSPPASVTGSVDVRTMEEILANQADPAELIQVFQMPDGWYAQEPRFVPAANAQNEDDGYLLFYAFDESQLSISGDVPDDTDARRRATSELWIVDARSMKRIVARIHLPQRVPYGLHGTWFSAEQIAQQRPVETLRMPIETVTGAVPQGLWGTIRDAIERFLQ